MVWKSSQNHYNHGKYICVVKTPDPSAPRVQLMETHILCLSPKLGWSCRNWRIVIFDELFHPILQLSSQALICNFLNSSTPPHFMTIKISAPGDYSPEIIPLSLPCVWIFTIGPQQFSNVDDGNETFTFARHFNELSDILCCILPLKGHCANFILYHNCGGFKPRHWYYRTKHCLLKNNGAVIGKYNNEPRLLWVMWLLPNWVPP